MKTKIKNIFLSLVLMLSVGCFAACGKDDPQKQTPTVNAVVENREFYVGDKLSEISLTLTEGDTAGTISWVSGDTELVLGENTCEWKFVPTDTNTFNEKTGTVTLSAVEKKEEPVVEVSVAQTKIYAESKLSTLTLTLAEGNTAGTISWVAPDTVLTEGENVCEWKFVPTDAETFKEVVGSITLNAVAQTLSSIEVKVQPEKLSYKAFETFDDSGMKLNAVFDGGKVEPVLTGWSVSYVNGTNLKAGDTKVVVTYKGKTVDVAITVSKIEIQKPVVAGTYVYDGTNKTATLKTDANSNLYTLSNNVYKEAGTHLVTVTLKDFNNYKWVGAQTKDVTVSFVIEKAEQTVQKTNYSGTYDGNSHAASVESSNSVKVYYSLEVLNSTNYTSASSEPLQFTNAGTVDVYYYIVGNSNYKDACGSVVVSIAKASSNVETNYAYSVAGNKNASIPESYVSVFGLNDAELEKTDLISFEFYTDEACLIKTSESSGAQTVGGAPKTAGLYYVLTKYAGSTNYNESSAKSVLLIDEDNSPAIAHGEDRAFAWKSEDGQTYVEAKTQDTGDLIEILATVKYGALVMQSKFVKQDGKWFISLDKVYEVVFSTANSENDTVTIYDEQGNEFEVVSKWIIPNYLGTYELDKTTASNPDDENLSAVVEIYNDYGVVKFSYNYSYTKNSGSVATAEKEGFVNLYTTTLVFEYNSSPMVSVTGYDDSDVLQGFAFGMQLNPSQVRGTYKRA